MRSRSVRFAGVYYILNVHNHRIYIGQSEDVEQRFKSHLSALRRQGHNNKALQTDWDRHGELAFTFDVLTIHTPWERHIRVINRIEEIERIFIRIYQSDNPIYGYNCNHSKKAIDSRARAQSLDAQANEAVRKYRQKSLPIGVDNVT